MAFAIGWQRASFVGNLHGSWLCGFLVRIKMAIPVLEHKKKEWNMGEREVTHLGHVLNLRGWKTIRVSALSGVLMIVTGPDWAK